MTVRILLVDDHDLILVGLRTVLAKCQDYVVIGEAKDGKTAIEMALKMQPDVILMDVALPEGNGIQAARKIRRQVPTAKIIGLSMNADRPIVEQMVRAGAMGYVLKSSFYEDLLDSIKVVQEGGRYYSDDILEFVPDLDNGCEDLPSEEIVIDMSETQVRFLNHLAMGNIASDPGTLNMLLKEIVSNQRNCGDLPSTPVDFSSLKVFGLTKREIEGLSYLPLGYTNNMIADAMGIQEITVKKHFRNAGRKLGAKGKLELLFQALTFHYQQNPPGSAFPDKQGS